MRVLPAGPNEKKLWLRFSLAVSLALLACTTPPEDEPPATDSANDAFASHRRPPIAAEDAPVYFQDDGGTSSVALADGAPLTFVADARPGRLYPSPRLDRLAIVRKGDGTEIYDRGGRFLGWIASDKFAGWTSNETIVAGMTKWDSAGNRLRDYRIAPEPAGTESIPFSFGAHSVSPDGRWLAVTRNPPDHVTGPAAVFLATSDGTVAGTAAKAGLWARDGSYVSLADGTLTRLSADLKTATTVPADIRPCGSQPWLLPDRILAWRGHLVSDYLVCTEPVLVDTRTGMMSPLQAVPDGNRDSQAFRRNIAFSPDGAYILFASHLAEAGVVVAGPTGGNQRRLAPGRRASDVAWDSWNPDAPARDPDAKGPAEKPPDVSATVPPGPPGTPPSTSDCRQGRWYRRTPATLPTQWPSPRIKSAGAFDPGRGVLVVDGGVRVAAESTTWEWDGRAGAWRNRSVMAPARPLPRFAHALVYDSRRSVFVLLGGSLDVNGASSATWWEWEPVSGKWAPVACPVVGDDFERAVYDAGRDTIWALDNDGVGVRFPRGNCAPASFRGPAGQRWMIGSWLGFEPAGGRVLLGGSRSFGHGVWAWDGTAWLWREATEGPGTHEYAAVAFDEGRGRLMSFSGLQPIQDGAGNVVSMRRAADLWEWDPAAGAWTRCGTGPETPLPRTNAVMAWDPGRRALVLFGGTGYDSAGDSVGALADVWEWAIP